MTIANGNNKKDMAWPLILSLPHPQPGQPRSPVCRALTPQHTGRPATKSCKATQWVASSSLCLSHSLSATLCQRSATTARQHRRPAGYIIPANEDSGCGTS